MRPICDFEKWAKREILNFIMDGHSRQKDAVAPARLRPAIHVLLLTNSKKGVDARDKPGHDDSLRVRTHPRLADVGRFPDHALAAFAPQQLDRIAVVDVPELSLVNAVAAQLL